VRTRALFDEFGAESLLPGFDPQVARMYARRRAEAERPSDSPFGDMSAFADVMGAAFAAEPTSPAEEDDGFRRAYGRGSERGRAASADPYAQPAAEELVEVEIDAMVTYIGGMTTISVPRPGGRVDTLRIRVQAGARAGDHIRLTGQGSSYLRAGPPSDLTVELKIREHPMIRRVGDDLEMDVPVTLLEAVQGGPITVPTPTGPTRVNLPQNCAGAKLRLRGRGVQRADRPGNLILLLRPVLPEQIDAAVLDACRTIERAYRQDVRDRLRL
jgi:curved DNA-binding protein